MSRFFIGNIINVILRFTLCKNYLNNNVNNYVQCIKCKDRTEKKDNIFDF